MLSLAICDAFRVDGNCIVAVHAEGGGSIHLLERGIDAVVIGSDSYRVIGVQKSVSASGLIQYFIRIDTTTVFNVHQTISF